MTEKQSKPWRIFFYIAIIVPTLAWLIIRPFLPEEENVEKREKAKTRVIEIRYGNADLKLPEDVDLEAVSVLQNALRSHD